MKTRAYVALIAGTTLALAWVAFGVVATVPVLLAYVLWVMVRPTNTWRNSG